MPSDLLGKMNTCQDYISNGRDVFKELDCNFTFPMFHLMSHWVEQICRYGTLQQYSVWRHEQVHQTNLKDCWNSSNRTLDYLPKVITLQRRILCFEIRELTLQSLAQCRGTSAAACKVLPSGADLAALIISQSYMKPEFIAPETCHDAKHPDAMIKDFRVLLDNTDDAMHRIPIYRGMWSLWRIRVVTRCIYWISNCTQWSSVFTVVLQFKLLI